MWFHVSGHVLVHVVIAWQYDWSRCICLATSLSETARFTGSAFPFEFSLGSIPSSSIIQFDFWHFISFIIHVHVTSSCDFSFFLFIQKFITPKILIQLTWGFLHNDLHDVYYFLMIFPEFVLGWKCLWPRVYVCMSYLVPCLPFSLWNNDGWSNEAENLHA